MKSRNPKIEIGTPATIQIGSDRYVLVVVGQSESGVTLFLQNAVEVEGVKDKSVKSWVVAPNAKDKPIRARKDHQGRWRQMGHKTYKPFITVGVADPYRDPSF